MDGEPLSTYPQRAPIASRLMRALVVVLLLAPVVRAQGPPPRIEIRRGDEVVFSLPEPEGARRVLFVGDSLTYFNELPWLVAQVAESRDPAISVVTRFSGRSGATLKELWNEGDALRLLRTEHWDFVVLQEKNGQILSKAPAEQRYLRAFLDEVKRRGATPILYATWPPEDEPQLRPRLRAAYRRVGQSLALTVAPVGSAWDTAIAAGISLYRDGLHANLAGSYLAACVLAAKIFGIDPRGARFRFPVSFATVETYRESLVRERLSPELAGRLQEIARKTVKAESRDEG